MITQFDDGWYFISNMRTFGPYTDRSAAEACQTQYEAFVTDAPDCHHKNK